MSDIVSDNVNVSPQHPGAYRPMRPTCMGMVLGILLYTSLALGGFRETESDYTNENLKYPGYPKNFPSCFLRGFLWPPLQERCGNAGSPQQRPSHTYVILDCFQYVLAITICGTPLSYATVAQPANESKIIRQSEWSTDYAQRVINF